VPVSEMLFKLKHMKRPQSPRFLPAVTQRFKRKFAWKS